MNRREAIKFVLVRSLGNFLLLMSLYGVVATFGPALLYETQFRIAQVRGVQFQVADNTVIANPAQRGEVIPSMGVYEQEIAASQAPRNDEGKETVNFASILTGNKEQVLVPKDTTFSIVIPKIGASARVYPNVDASNPDEFLPVLKHGVAHAKGTVFPGMNGNTYLFAHSADNWWDVGRYNAVFYLLKNLEPGDEITVFFENVRYEYIVSQKFITEPSDVTLLTKTTSPDKQQLILQTCWPPGTTLKRQFVIAVPKKTTD